MKRWHIGVIAIIVALAVSVPVQSFAAREFDTLVMTKYGLVQGYRTQDREVVIWKGIPYAKPPVGDLRWKAPEDPEPWEGVLDATEHAQKCAQLRTYPDWRTDPVMEGSEDCLYLDIYRPARNWRGLPVYVWIHGGANNFGAASDYDGSALAEKGKMIVVVIQYRLGPLGWFYHEALQHAGDPINNSGNFGALDTIQALRWIKENIKAFGGNRNKITIAGESAGAHNVMNLVISPLAKGLFHRAISQSGGMTTEPVQKGTERAEVTIRKLLEDDGYTWDDWDSWTREQKEAYLRSQTAEEIILTRYGKLGTHFAVEDGTVIPGSVVQVIRSGNYNKVPMILGANKYEMKAFLPMYGALLPEPLNTRWPALRYAVLDLGMPLDNYLPTDFDKDLYEVTGYYGSLNWIAKFVDERARALVAQKAQRNVYAYRFAWDGPDPYSFVYGACHAAEIPFFFGEDTGLWGYAFSPGNDTPGRQALSEVMMGYLKRFVRSGSPNGPGLPKWRPWSNKEGKPKFIHLDADEDNPIIGMSTEELTIPAVQAALAAEIATWTPEQQQLWSWVPWSFQWFSPE